MIVLVSCMAELGGQVSHEFHYIMHWRKKHEARSAAPEPAGAAAE